MSRTKKIVAIAFSSAALALPVAAVVAPAVTASPVAAHSQMYYHGSAKQQMYYHG